MADQVHVYGLVELLHKLDDPHLVGDPLREFFEKASIHVEDEAKRRSEVDTGRTRASHTHEIDAIVVPLWARIGPNTKYARPLHDGSRPHFPPVAAIEAWARRHGMAGRGYAIARAIARRGTKGRPWLRDALVASRSAVNGYWKIAGAQIEAYWRR